MIPEEFAGGLPDLVRFAVALCGDPDTGEQLLTQALARVQADLGSLDDAARARAATRVWTVRAFLSEGMRLGAPVARDVDRPSTGRADAGDDLDSRFRRISKLARAVLLLRYDGGLPPADVARAIGSTPDGIERYLSALQKQLRIPADPDEAGRVLAPVFARAGSAGEPVTAALLERLRTQLPDLVTEPSASNPLDLSPEADEHVAADEPTAQARPLELAGALEPPEGVADAEPGTVTVADVADVRDLLDLSPGVEHPDPVDMEAEPVPQAEPPAEDEDTSVVPEVVAGELVEQDPGGAERGYEAPTVWHTVTGAPASRPATTGPGGTRRPPARRTTAPRRSAARAVSAAPTQGLVDAERAESGQRLSQRVIVVAGVVLAAVLIGVGIAIASTSGSDAPGNPHSIAHGAPIGRTLPGAIVLGTWSGTGPGVVTTSGHQPGPGRELAVMLECTGAGPVTVGPVAQPDCSSGGVTGSVDPATAIRLQVNAPAVTTWKFSLVNQPQSRTNGSLVALPNPMLSAPAAEEVAAKAATGPSTIQLSGPAGPAVRNVRFVLTCNGDGVSLSSDDGSVVKQYTHSCFSGWSYEFDVMDVRLPTTLHVSADPQTSWRLVAVPF